MGQCVDQRSLCESAELSRRKVVRASRVNCHVYALPSAFGAVLHLTIRMKGEDVMSLGIHIRRVDGVTILDLSGLITYGNGSVTVCDAVCKELEKGFRRILLDLRDITYIDSSGVGELIFAFTVVKNSGGDLKLLNLRMRLHDRLQTASLFNVFEVYDDESAAVASFPA